MPAQPLTDEQKADAARLRLKFLSWQKTQKDSRLPSSQAEAGHQLGFNQSALSQYLLGKIPLNIEALARFSKLLSCDPADISPTLARRATELAPPRRVFLSHSGSDRDWKTAEAVAGQVITTNYDELVESVIASINRASEAEVPREQLLLIRQMVDTFAEQAAILASNPRFEDAKEAGKLASAPGAEDVIRNAIPGAKTGQVTNERPRRGQKAG